VAIQRRLAEHRREHGFATSVRIGVHTAEATIDGSDYRGRGVHLAARVAAVAGGEEIIISDTALESADAVRFPVSDGRDVVLKGIEGSVRVHNVEWR
jgi:class 3 adenylate cyclase